MSGSKAFVLPAHDERIELVPLPLGYFNMGSTAGPPIELAVHHVVIDDPVLLGKFPVIQGQWTVVMGTNPSMFTEEDRLPVDSVSWADAERFLPDPVRAKRISSVVDLATRPELTSAAGRRAS